VNKHAGDEGPGPGTQLIDIGREDKPVEDIGIKSIQVEVGHLVDNKEEFEDDKQEGIDGKQHHQGVVVLPQENFTAAFVFRHCHIVHFQVFGEGLLLHYKITKSKVQFTAGISKNLSFLFYSRR
jgi:hypothetical protein